jgi:hypothetical protein
MVQKNGKASRSRMLGEASAHDGTSTGSSATTGVLHCRCTRARDGGRIDVARAGRCRRSPTLRPFPMMCSAAGARKLLLGARLVTSVRETGRSELDRPTLRPWMDMAYARGWR